MCGIVGYVGKKEACEVLLDGLRRLEYRGYDSAGLAILNNGRIGLAKKKGKLSVLRDLVSPSPLPGTVGIGHTRWATHGFPDDVNAHPHIDCKGLVAVVHNGIIENHGKLQKRLEKENHRFRSRTDTETLAHLVEKYLEKQRSLEGAVRQALRHVEGSYALAVVSTREPDKVVVARMMSPLVVGVAKEEFYVASDVPALLPYTRDVIYLEDGDLAVLTLSGVKIFDQNGKTKHKTVSTISWDIQASEKAGHPHFMLKEIYEQPQAVKATFHGRVSRDKTQVVFEELTFSKKELRSFEKIYMVACGTAFYAGFAGKYVLEQLAQIPVECDIASEFRYRQPRLDSNTLLIAISQSGETADTLASVREAKSKGAKVLAVCNVMGSTLTREADCVLHTYAGPEICVVATKSYLTQLITLYLFALHLASVRKKMSPQDIKKYVQAVEKLPEHIEKVIAREKEIQEVAKKHWRAEHVLFLGRHVNYPSALEGALKLKEISYVAAEGYASGEMKHGPIAVIDSEMPVVCVAVQSKVYDKILSNIQEVRARNGKVVSIATEGDEEIQKLSDDCVYVPETLELLTPVLVAPVLQLFAYHVGVLRGCDIDQPRNLAKSVTVE